MHLAVENIVAGYGRIADLGKVWETCDLMISPLRNGSGVSVKVAEALYHGVPLLATRCSMRGLDVPPDLCIAIEDQEDAWVRVIQDVAPYWRGRRVTANISAMFTAAAHTARLQSFVTGGKRMGYI